MALEEFIFPDGQPEAIVHWQIKSPTEKIYPDHVFNKKHKVCFLNQLFGNVEDAGESSEGEPLPYIGFYLSCLVSW